MTFDPTKPVQTRDGRKARIICTDANNKQPIVALITAEDGYEYTQDYTKDGFYFITAEQSKNDLINIPERNVQWANVYEYGTEGRYESRTAVDAFARASRLGVLKLTYENDELVSHEYIKIRL